MEFRAGRVLTQSFSIFIKNIVGFLILGLLITAPVIAHNIWVVSADNLFAMATRAQQASVMWSLLEQGLSFFVQATVVYAVFRQIRGEKPSTGEAVRVGFSRLASVIGVVLLLGLSIIGSAFPGGILGFAIGSPFVAIICAGIPALLVLMMFYVAIPTAVVERPGVMMSLKRSQQLTAGHRWGIFGLVLITAVLAIIVGVILQRAFIGDAFEVTESAFRNYVIVEAITSLAFTLFGAVVAAVTYHDLRAAKDGVSVDELVAVFE